MTQDASTGDVVAPSAEAGPPALVGVATARRYALALRAASTCDKYNRVWDGFDA